MDENFIDGLKDITNRFWIDERLFIDMEDQNRNKKVRFLRDRDALGPRKVEGAQKLKDTGIDTNSLSWEALCRVFSIKLTSGFDLKGKTTKDYSRLGYCLAPEFFDHHTKIIVHIDAELVWPLLVDEYTKSEKLMANIVLASCIAHEMMVSPLSSQSTSDIDWYNSMHLCPAPTNGYANPFHSASQTLNKLQPVEH